MSLKYTPAPELGRKCPDFNLPAVRGGHYQLADFEGAKALVVMFICNHCPYVQAIEDRILSLSREMQKKGVQFVAICANDPEEYPDDSWDNLKKRAESKDYPFPYLQDINQNTAKEFGAVCTPDFFVFDGQKKLAYRGRLDDSWKDSSAVQKQELKAALEALLAGQEPSPEQHPSMGCSIKWKS